MNHEERLELFNEYLIVCHGVDPAHLEDTRHFGDYSDSRTAPSSYLNDCFDWCEAQYRGIKPNGYDKWMELSTSLIDNDVTWEHIKAAIDAELTIPFYKKANLP